jgi:3-hydroxyisobutyrate dehydrogenase-like beta-hydroxyacid dehydrogenase
MHRSVIALLHPGEMGAAVGGCLAGRGHQVLWASAGRSPATAARARAAGLADAGRVRELARRAEVIFSICPPHAALEVARAVAGAAVPAAADGGGGAARSKGGAAARGQGGADGAGRGSLYVDANAVSPATAREVAAIVSGAGFSYVDGGIIGPPPARAGTTRLYLSGARAGQVAALLAGTPLAAEVVGEEPGAASAVKMAYAAWTKGSAALLLAARALARAEGVEETLLAEWAQSQPALTGQCERAAQSATGKGWRWAGEMMEIAASMATAGLPPGFHQAAAEIYRRVPRAAAAGGEGPAPGAVLSALVARAGGGQQPVSRSAR